MKEQVSSSSPLFTKEQVSSSSPLFTKEQVSSSSPLFTPTIGAYPSLPSTQSLLKGQISEAEEI
jgi:hypothetical protein